MRSKLELLKVEDKECQVEWRSQEVAIVRSPLGNLAVACLNTEDDIWYSVWFEASMESAMKKARHVMDRRGVGLS